MPHHTSTDLRYVEELSLVTDVKIMALTIPTAMGVTSLTGTMEITGSGDQGDQGSSGAFRVAVTLHRHTDLTSGDASIHAAARPTTSPGAPGIEAIKLRILTGKRLLSEVTLDTHLHGNRHEPSRLKIFTTFSVHFLVCDRPLWHNRTHVR